MNNTLYRLMTSIAFVSIAFHINAAYAAAPDIAQRASAAAQTALHSSECKRINPFYWEIGDRNRTLASGSVGGDKYRADTTMPIASASKWLWGAYVVQKEKGKLNSNDIAYLNMTSGYTRFRYLSCAWLVKNNPGTTVADCFNARNLGGHNSDRNDDAIGHFYYDGGHFQKEAIDLGLGNMNNVSLQHAMQQQLGTDVQFSFDSPQLAGGAATSAKNYALFLRKILGNRLLMHDALGTHAVCTNPATCSDAMYAPVPSKESWHYSLGHWVEDDPVKGDGAFSSPGAFGFYPWIDHSKTYYGIVARKASVAAAVDSAECGREIRRAWMNGMPQ
ncbi:MAG TPA: hypothetical protein VG962_06260 [Steroidobacteraceae bacterium]|nr:hypothetical protein [Steroidobacteraceae bacterium]